MRKIDVATKVVVYEDTTQLTPKDLELMKKAIEASEKAYAPYSNFKVGCALLLDNGEIILGNNQENAAYPSGMCAERVAIWKAGSQYPRMKVNKMFIVAKSSTIKVDKPVGPCGACRQTLLEYEVNQKEKIEVLFMGEIGEIVKVESIGSLLPFSFDSSYL